MAAYKDEERGTWYVSFYYEDWTGAKKRKVKRGFRTKKEALNFEAERRKDCGSATHGTIRRHHSWGLLTPTSLYLNQIKEVPCFNCEYPLDYFSVTKQNPLPAQ